MMNASHAEELKVIQNLMEELQDKMSYGKDDLEERLGRKKPAIEVMKVEGEMEPEGGELGDLRAPEMPADDDESPVMGMDEEEEEESPEDKLKSRLMRLRG